MERLRAFRSSSVPRRSARRRTTGMGGLAAWAEASRAQLLWTGTRPKPRLSGAPSSKSVSPTRRGSRLKRAANVAAGRPTDRARGSGAANAAAEEKRKRQMADVAEEFANERDRFFHDAERKWFCWACGCGAHSPPGSADGSVAFDGAVRVALGQLAATTDVKLSCLCEVDLWMEAMAMIPNLACGRG